AAERGRRAGDRPDLPGRLASARITQESRHMELSETSPVSVASSAPVTGPAPARSLTARSVPRHSGWATLAVLGVALALGVAAYLHFSANGEAIAYGDAKSHLLIARRVLFADTPGAGQLGGVWLPLPHLLMLPLAWSDRAYYTGLAGSAVMMACYVLATLLT